MRAAKTCALVAFVALSAGFAGCSSKDEAGSKPTDPLDEDPPGFVPAEAAQMLPLPANAGPPQVERRDAGTQGGGGDASADGSGGNDGGGGGGSDSGAPADAGSG